jgi:hypothetical protein
LFSTTLLPIHPELGQTAFSQLPSCQEAGFDVAAIGTGAVTAKALRETQVGKHNEGLEKNRRELDKKNEELEQKRRELEVEPNT